MLKKYKSPATQIERDDAIFRRVTGYDAEGEQKMERTRETEKGLYEGRRLQADLDRDRSALPQAGLGKFEGQPRIAEFAHAMSMNGFLDNEIGSVESGGWYGISSGSVITEDRTKEDVAAIIADYAGFEPDPEELAFLEKAKGGFIISEDDQGFVTVDWKAHPGFCGDAWFDIVEEVRSTMEVEEEADAEMVP
ncbi:MAG: hypothetical protein V2I24_14955 [Halieaceae bacterium]|jgi:hypothetical protein|nr:hypothetical protein [Halieaceae bacterium]